MAEGYPATVTTEGTVDVALLSDTEIAAPGGADAISLIVQSVEVLAAKSAGLH